MGDRMKREKLTIHIMKGREIIKKASLEETDNGGVVVYTDTAKQSYSSLTEAVVEMITDCWR